MTQFDMKYVEAGGLVKFDFLGLKTLSVLQRAVALLKRSRRRDRSRPPGLGRRGLFACFSAVTRSACSSWKSRACGERWPRSSDLLRGYHRARRALPAGPDGQHPDVLRAQERARTARLSASAARRPMLKETYGIIVYQEQVMQSGADPRRLHAGPGRSAAPGDGQEDQGGDGRPARGFRRGCGERGIGRPANELIST